MADTKAVRALRIETLATALEQKLENEAAILDVLVAGMGKGQSPEALWEQLHRAAARDDRAAELAFAYERLVRDKRMKALGTQQQVQVLIHASSFFADTFGDAEGAEGYLEKALALVPGDVRAFDKLEALLVARQEGKKLAELYAATAPHREGKEEQLRLLRRAVELAESFGADDKTIKLYEAIRAIAPNDAAARKALEDRYQQAGRFADLAKILEHHLAEDAPAVQEARAVRARLIEIYAGMLGEVERALPHVENILEGDPQHPLARKVAEQLLTHKAVLARVAAMLESVHDRTGNAADAARMLELQVDAARGPKKLEAQKRLAAIYHGKLGELAKTFALDEQVLAIDPSDAETRARYVKLAASLDKKAEATRVLARVLPSVKDPSARAKVGIDLAELYVAAGDPKKARAAYQGVLDLAADDEATLKAARALAQLLAEARETRPLATVLARLAEIEVDASAKIAANERLAVLSEVELKDPQGAIAAYRRLLGTKRDQVALMALEGLYEQVGAFGDLAEILERRAALEKERGTARDLRFRAAELRSTKLADRAGALEAWRAFVSAYGGTREAHARLLPLLEQEKKWEDLATTLAAEAKLVEGAERAATLARLAQTRATRLGDATGALEAWRQALAIDPAERASRAALDKLLAQGDLRREAADVLEPIVRKEKNAAQLARVLETRAQLGKSAADRLRAFEEAAELVAKELRDPKRALDLAGRGLREAALEMTHAVPAWLDRIDRLAKDGDAAKRAAVLQEALGERPVTNREILELARRAGEALVAAGDIAGALAALRRALAFEPSSADLLGRVDTLLREQGDPHERLALHRAALEQPSDAARRRELLHAIGGIERRDLGDPEAAIATYRRALEEDAGDRAAYEAILEIHEAAGDLDAVYAELERASARQRDDERIRTWIRMSEIAVKLGALDKAAAHYREVLGSDIVLGEEELAPIEEVARVHHDGALLRAVIDRRVQMALEPLEEATWLERLGEIELGEGRDEAAAHAWKRAAVRAEQGDERARVVRLWERVLDVLPNDRDAAEKLVALHKDGDGEGKLARAYDVLFRSARSGSELVRMLAAFEAVAIRTGAIDQLLREIDTLFADEPRFRLIHDHKVAMLSLRARALASDPKRAGEASDAFKRLLGEHQDEAALAAFEELIARRGSEGHADKRWLFETRHERASDVERARVLVAWAEFEELVAGDAKAAADLYARLLAIDPEHDEALARRARLLLAIGEVEAAAEAVALRRDRSEGAARSALDLELASIYLERLDRPEDALAAIAPVLEASPADAAAIRLVTRALERDATRLAAARLLERAADATDEPEIATQILDTLLATPAEVDGLSSARRGWYERLLDRPGLGAERALALALRAASELQSDLAIWERAEKLARDQRKPELVAEAYKRELGHFGARPSRASKDPEALEELGRRAVEWQEEWFDEPEAVVFLLRRTVELAPGSAWAFERLKLLYNLGERWDELFALYDQAIAGTDDTALRAELLEDVALAAKDLAIDPRRAIRYFEQLLEVKDEPRIRASLERLYERHGRFQPLVDLLQRELEGTEGDTAQRLRARIGFIQLDGVGDPDAAIATALSMLVIDDARAEAFAIIEKSIKGALATAATDEATRERRLRAADLLKARYRGAGRAADLVRVLEVELEAAATGEERAGKLREIVALRVAELDDDAGAFEAVAALVLLEPHEAKHREELERLADRAGLQAKLAAVLASAADRLEGAERRALLERASEIAGEVTGDLATAVTLDRSIFAIDPSDVRTARRLEQRLARLGRVVERCEILERLAAIEPEPSGRRAALLELARLALAEARDPDRAVVAYRTVLDGDANDLEALDGLVLALEDRARWKELLEILERRAGLRDAVGARADRARAAEIMARELGEIDRAIKAYQKLRKQYGADDASTDALASLLDARGKNAELAKLLASEAAHASDPARAADLYRRLGDVHREKTKDLGEAIASYEHAFAKRSDDPAVRDGLEALVALIDSPGRVLARAVAALVELYARANDPSGTIALLEPRLAVAADDAARVAVLVETAALTEEHARDASAAYAHTFRAFQLDSSRAPLDDLVRRADASERWADVAEALASWPKDRALDSASAASLWWHAAIFFRDRRGDAAAAEAALDRALEIDPKNLEVLLALAALQRRSPSRALVATLLRIADATNASLDALREAIETAIEPVGDRVLAKTIAEKLLDAVEARWRGDEEARSNAFASLGEAAIWALDVLVRMMQDDAPGDVARLFLRGARLPFDRDERRRLRLRAAELADVDATIAIYEELLAEDPKDDVATPKLEALYRTHGRSSELLALRHRQIAIAGDVGERQALRFDLATLLVEGGDAKQAIATLRENLRESKPHLRSVAKLAELLEANGQHAELVKLCEDEAAIAESAGDVATAASMWGRAATMSEQRLGDLKRAAASHRKAAALGATSSAEALARLLSDRGEHAAAAEVLEKLFVEASDETRGPLALRLADAYLAAGRPSEARDRIERALAARFAPALRDKLATIYRDTEAWDALAELVTSDVARATDRATRVARLREAAEIHRAHRDDAARAVPLLEQAAELVPEDQSLRLELCAALGAAGRIDETEKILRGMIESYGGRRPKERALVHHQLAMLALAAGDRARALGELEAALRIDPAHAEILHALARLALEEGQLERANRTYRALLLVVRRPSSEASMSLSATSAKAALGVAAVSRAEILFELHHIATKMNEEARAAEYLDSAFEVARESAEEQARFFAALRARGSHVTLARALEARLSSIHVDAEAAAVLEELASLYDRHLDRAADALEARLRGLALLPSATAAASAFELAKRLGQIDKYVTTVSRLAEMLGPRDASGAADLFVSLGRAFDDDAASEAQARAAYERAESLLEAGDARRKHVWTKLEAIHTRTGDASAAAQVLEKRIVAGAAEDPASRADPFYRLAAIRLASLDTEGQGLALVDRALGEQPDLDRAEAIVRAAIAARPTARKVRFLEQFARDRGKDRALVDALVMLADLGDDDAGGGERARDALREAVELATRLADPALVEALLRRVLEASNDDAEIRWALVALADRREATGALGDAADLRERAARASAPADQKDLLLDVAALAAGTLGDLDRAARLYEELREKDPEDRRVWSPLADVHRKKGDRDALAALLEAVIPLVDEIAEKSRLRLERAELVVATDEALATSLLSDALLEDPSQIDAAMMLASIYERRGDKVRLKDLLARQLDAAKDRSDKASIVSLSMRLGALLEQEWDEQAALDVYQAVLDWDSSSRDALRALVRVTMARDDSMDLIDALERLLAVEIGGEAVELALRLAQIRDAHGDKAAAERALEQGYKAAPESARLREELVLRYTAREAWKKLADVHIRDADSRTIAEEKVECLCAAADVLRQQARDPAGAAEILRQAFEVDPRDRDVLLALVEAWGATGEHPRAIEAITKALATSPEDAWLYRTRAGLHEASGFDRAALDDLEAAYAKSNGSYAGELVAQIDKVIALAANDLAPAARAEERRQRLRAADVLAKSGDVERARAQLVDLAKRDGKDREALRMLAAIEDASGRWDASSAIYRRLLPLEDGDALVHVALRLADACERGDRLGDARSGLERALRVRPNDDGVRARLRSLYAATGASRELALMLLEDAHAASDVAGRFGFLVRAGGLLLGSEGDPERAAAALDEAHRLKPEDLEATLLLSDALAAAYRYGDARALLHDALQAHKGRRSPKVGAIHRRVSRLDVGDGDLSAALASLLRAFENDPQNGELAMELGAFALDIDDAEIATRAFRAVTMMKPRSADGSSGADPSQRALAYFRLGELSIAQGDRRRGRLMMEKALVEDPSLQVARDILGEL